MVQKILLYTHPRGLIMLVYGLWKGPIRSLYAVHPLPPPCPPAKVMPQGPLLCLVPHEPEGRAPGKASSVGSGNTESKGAPPLERGGGVGGLWVANLLNFLRLKENKNRKQMKFITRDRKNSALNEYYSIF